MSSTSEVGRYRTGSANLLGNLVGAVGEIERSLDVDVEGDEASARAVLQGDPTGAFRITCAVLLRKAKIHMVAMLLTCPPRTGPGVMLVLGLKERGVKMARRKHTAEQIINKLREAEVAISAGSTVAEVSRHIGVTQQTFYRWRTEYGGLKIDQARRLKQLETENGRLRRAVADLTLDNQILREAAEGNF